ncbi:winged helix-turn-helix transcriptional regulator [Paracoccus saliphilus]|uniref:Helix-turn-helix transcriptional regulator n=1 Tax=Paracoccus saliphilus TaxID=405559 RepID=A0AA45W8F1_9RHOB|nr:helix-turn-helix domain-containing protein [Paracoccus saliphilus]WCR02967.1 helix-turn-helix transcriptional regulator [Paracoccus saliphilus]SIT16424.1 transcriptional regulator, HxlR family [Paracoccus saliphilus]
MKRWYDDACGTAFALELIGERWALLVVRELMFGPRRFGDLRASLNGISANVLTQRLAGLEQAGIVLRRKLPPPASVWVYELTPWGYESEEAIKVLGRWAVRSPAHDPTLPLSEASLMLSFRTMYAGGIEALIGFRMGEEGFIAHANRNEIAIRRDEPEDVDLIFSGSPMAIASVVYGGRPISDAQASGDLLLEGSHSLAEDFVKLFPLPPKIDTM